VFKKTSYLSKIKSKNTVPDFVEVKARYLCYEPEFNCDYYELIAESKKEDTRNYIVQTSQFHEETEPHAILLFKGVKSYQVSNVLETSSKPEREDEPFVEEKIRKEYEHSICCPKATRVKVSHIETLKANALIYRYYAVTVVSEKKEQEFSFNNGDRTVHARVETTTEVPPPFGKQATKPS